MMVVRTIGMKMVIKLILMLGATWIPATSYAFMVNQLPSVYTLQRSTRSLTMSHHSSGSWPRTNQRQRQRQQQRKRRITKSFPFNYQSSSNLVPTKPLHSSSVEGDFDPDALQRSVDQVQSGSIRATLRALYKFTRPHTIRGTILASIAGTIRALLDTPGAIHAVDWGLLLPRAGVGMVALLLGNAFIVGINQIYDDDIDKVNKPFLPVASGEMSKSFAWLTVGACGILGPLLVKAFFPLLLFKLYMLGWLLGCIYSVPPIRTKQNPILAGLTIAIVRGFLLNFGVYYAVKDAIVGPPFVWSPKVAFMARFMTVFATCIAVTKDLPDVEGDLAYSISTFATRVGVSKIAMGATALLLLNYAHAIATGFLFWVQRSGGGGIFHMVPMVGGHVALATLLLLRYRQFDPKSKASIKVYYKHIWDLFYLEYGLYTLI